MCICQITLSKALGHPDHQVKVFPAVFVLGISLLSLRWGTCKIAVYMTITSTRLIRTTSVLKFLFTKCQAFGVCLYLIIEDSDG